MPILTQTSLEPVYYTEFLKKSTWPVTYLQNIGPLKVLNDTKLIINESKWYHYIQKSQIQQSSGWSGTLSGNTV